MEHLSCPMPGCVAVWSDVDLLKMLPGPQAEQAHKRRRVHLETASRHAWKAVVPYGLCIWCVWPSSLALMPGAQWLPLRRLVPFLFVVAPLLLSAANLCSPLVVQQ